MSRLPGPQHLRPVPVLPEGDAGGVGGLGRDADHPHRAGVVPGLRGRAARVVKLQYSPAEECGTHSFQGGKEPNTKRDGEAGVFEFFLFS